MPHVVWSAPAVQDLSRLRAFLEGKNEIAANRAVAVIREGVQLLQKQPEAGRRSRGAPEGTRQLTLRFGRAAYMVLYFHDAESLLILRLRHSREAGFSLRAPVPPAPLIP